MDFKVIKESASDFIFEYYDKTLFISFVIIAFMIWVFTIIWMFKVGVYLIIFPISITIISAFIFLRAKTIEINTKGKKIIFSTQYRGINSRKVMKTIGFSDIEKSYNKTVRMSKKLGYAYWLCLKLKNNEVELLYSTDNQNYFESMMERIKPYLKLI